MRTVFCRFHFAPLLLISWTPGFADPIENVPRNKPPTVKQISPDVVELEGIQVDRNKQTVTLQAEVTLSEGILEYALVNTEGKVHESLLSTKVEPIHLHTAMLLLGARDAKESDAGAPPAQITSEFLKTAPTIDGDPLELTIRWVDLTGKKVEQPLASLIEAENSHKTIPLNGWLYNGSILSQGKFLAQLNRSIISLVSDASALANQSFPGNNQPETWTVNKEKVPPEKTPVELIFYLVPKTSSSQ